MEQYADNWIDNLKITTWLIVIAIILGGVSFWLRGGEDTLTIVIYLLCLFFFFF